MSVFDEPTGGAKVEEKTITKKLPGWAKERRGYPARRYGNGHCPKCGMEIIIIGSQSCPKCGRIS